jgi:hypothetical protein
VNAVLAELADAVRDIGRITFVEPVREGRPRPSAWPRGLREIGVATTIVFALLGLAILFAVPLRQFGDLTLAPGTNTSVPEVATPLLLGAVLLALILVNTAALHTSWWLRGVLLVLSASTIALLAAPAWSNLPVLAVSLGCYLALVVFTLFRAGRDYAWWEFVVVAVLVLAAAMVPWAGPSPASSWGIDLRPTFLAGAVLTLQPLVVPAVMVAGSAPAQVVVTGAQAIASRPVRLSLFVTGFGLALAWLVVVTWQAVGSDALTPSALAGALVALVAVAALVLVWVRRARVPAPPQPRHYPEVWGAWLYPLAVAISVLVVFTLPLILLSGVAGLAGATDLAAGVNSVIALVNGSNPGLVVRGLLGVVTLVIAWRFSLRSRLVEAVALGSFAVLVLMDLAGLLPALRFLQDRSTEGMGLIASGVAVVAALLALARRRFDRGTAVGVMTVALLAVLYPQRNLIAEPLTAALASSGPVVLVFGLAWRVFTEAQVTYSSSKRYPQSTRVLLFLANTLFATAGVAYVTLTRGLGTDADLTIWGELGDSTLGDPLFLTGLVAGLWLVLRPDRSLERAEPLGPDVEPGTPPDAYPDAATLRPPTDSQPSR